MSYLEGTEQLKALLQKQASLVIPNLQDIVGKLIKLVDDGTLYSFEFSGNMANGVKPEEVIIYVTPSKAHRKIQLGHKNPNLDFFRTNLSADCFEQLTNMHEYLIFVNDFLKGSIPEIRRPTKYRNGTEARIESDQPKVPVFAKELLNQQL